MKLINLRAVLALSLVFIVNGSFLTNSWAQEEEEYSQDPEIIASGVYEKPQSELGVQAGKFLPSDIDGVTEILSLWGIRTAFLTLGKSSYVELGGTVGRSEGVEWLNGSLSLRFDRPIETLLSYVYFGADYTSYEPIDGSFKRKSTAGGHVGGGVMAYIADSLWFRLGMKFNIEPGTSLYVNAGFTFRFKASEVKKQPTEEEEEGEDESSKEKEAEEKAFLNQLVPDRA